MDSRYYVLTMGSARSNPRDAAWRTALTCPIAVSLWSGRRGSPLATGGGRCHDENVEGAHQRPGSAGFGRGRLPVVLRAPMLAGCSSCPRQRPLRSASPSIEALSAEALSAAVELRGAGCSQGWRTTHRRGNAPGPSSAGSRYLCRYGGAGWTAASGASLEISNAAGASGLRI
jgi:hypothetical protein